MRWLIILSCLLCLPARGEDPLRKLTSPPPEFQNNFGNLRSPLRFENGQLVASPNQWQERRAEILKEWTDLMGQWPDVITDPEVTIIDTTRREDFTQHQIRFLWTPTEETTGYLLIPDRPAKEKLPAIITVYYEPETAIGLGKENRDFAYQLTKRGFVTLSIGTTAATAAKTYSLYWPSIAEAKVQPLSMLAYAAANAFEVLASRPEVDRDRIGIVGHSFGGKWSMFASCLYEKFACAAWSDPGIVFAPRPSVNYWEPWYLGYHPKPWRKRSVPTEENPATGLYPQLLAQGRDLHELHALMAPRPFLVSGGSEDRPAQWKALNHTIKINKILGYSDRVAMHNRPDHGPTPESNEVIYRFFEDWLNPPQP